MRVGTRTAVVTLIAMIASGRAATAAQMQVGSHSIRYGSPSNYDYAPAVLRIGTTDHAWWGVGANMNGNVYSGDLIVHAQNSATAGTVELCPTYTTGTDFGTQYSVCNSDFHPGVQLQLTGACSMNLQGDSCWNPTYYYGENVDWDWEMVNDPSVVQVGSQYYLYYGSPRSGPCGAGVNNQIFLARSSNGSSWTKYPSTTQFPQPIIPYFIYGSCGGTPTPYNAQGTTDRYGIGEPSVVYKTGTFYMYYSFLPWQNEMELRRATSTNGITFSNHTKITSGNSIDGGDSGGGAEVRYIPGWDLWFMVIPSPGRASLRWNISRDGIHWLPASFRTAQRTISTLNGYALAPAVKSDINGHVGDGQLQTSKIMEILYTTGPAGPNDPTTWDIASVTVTLAQESAYGFLDSINTQKVAAGWAYDLDAGVNDAAANGGPAAALGHYTAVRAIAVSQATGQRYEGPWQTAQLSRADLVTAGVAPDPYHGFQIDLKSQGFPSGTYTVTMEAGEFPVGMGATALWNAFTVTLP